jgi:hypothetical protein
MWFKKEIIFIHFKKIDLKVEVLKQKKNMPDNTLPSDKD